MEPITQSLISSSQNDLGTIPPPENSVTTILNYCKSKILKPYLRLLSIIGLRPLISDQPQPICFCMEFLNYLYMVQIIVILLLGYILQYMACYRRDRGLYYKTSKSLLNAATTDDDQICYGPIFWSFIIPSILHFIGYLHAVFIIRHSDDDQLPVLIERVFLSSTNYGASQQKKLLRTLWLFIFLSLIWVFFSIIIINYMIISNRVDFKWLQHSSLTTTTTTTTNIIFKILLIISTIWHDIVQATIISNYCVQLQLLIVYLEYLKEKLLQYPVIPLDWMRHIEDFKKMLNYINNKISPSVSIFIIINISYGISGLLWIYNFIETITIFDILNIFLWFIIALVPFIQAGRLSNGCESLKNAGQEARVRPLVHQNTPSFELDSILLYTNSLKLRAKLFSIPITLKYLFIFSTISTIVVLVLGQCHYLNIIN